MSEDEKLNMKLLVWDFEQNKVVYEEISDPIDPEIVKLEKKKKSGLRKCKGHKLGLYFDQTGKCMKCGGYKKL